MSSDPIEKRRRYFSEISEHIQIYEDKSFEYERQAIEFANSGFRILTYLNGGALVAIPTAFGLFQTSIQDAKIDLVRAAIFFVAGLLFIVFSQGSAFFTMAKRSEAHMETLAEHVISTALTHYPDIYPDATAAQETAKKHNENNEAKIRQSNFWRLLGIVFFWMSLIAFIVGCYFGALALLTKNTLVQNLV